jgi:UDP-glucose:(heptosyl)LPS alpha-1,3-glucosyltransferase
LINAMVMTGAAHLVVVGEDKRSGAMLDLCARRGLSDRVHFVGGQNDVKPWYGAADCFVLPTLYDPFPNAALEAMASGLPVITTLQCGAAEFIESGVCGYVYAGEDEAALTAALKGIGDVERARVMGAAARTAVSGLGIDAMAAQLGALYRSLLLRADIHSV